MSTPSADVPSPAPLCLLCEKNLVHADVVMVGVDTLGSNISVHPECLGRDEERDKLIKELAKVHIYTAPGRSISPAKQIVVKRKVKEIFKALTVANQMKKMKAQAEAAQS